MLRFLPSCHRVWIEPNNRKSIIFTVLLGVLSILPVPFVTLFTGGLPHLYIGQTPKGLILSCINLLAHVPFVLLVLPIAGWTFVVVYFWIVIFILRFFVSLYYMLDAVYLHSRLLRNYPITQGECSFLFYTIPFRWLMKQAVYVSQSQTAPHEVLFVQQQVELLHQNRAPYPDKFIVQLLQQYIHNNPSQSSQQVSHHSSSGAIDPFFNTPSQQDGIVYISNDQPSMTAFENAKFYPTASHASQDMVEVDMNTMAEQKEMTRPLFYVQEPFAQNK